MALSKAHISAKVQQSPLITYKQMRSKTYPLLRGTDYDYPHLAVTQSCRCDVNPNQKLNVTWWITITQLITNMIFCL